MSMEPGQPDAPPRPKGFVRRNWFLLIPLICGLGLLPWTLKAKWQIAGSKRWFFIVLHQQRVAFGTSPVSVNLSYLLNVHRLWNRPWWEFDSHHERVLGIGTDSLWSFRMEIPVALLLGWITLREWRRKRAANGAERHR
jgi:hypothetical protein